MTWSDAARAAAAQARRLHRHERRKASTRGEALAHKTFMERGSVTSLTGKWHRKSIADRIRSIRSAQFLVGPKGALTSGGKYIIKHAAESTVMRNFLKTQRVRIRGER